MMDINKKKYTNISLSSQFLSSHVTAVKFVLDFLIVGEGNCIVLYDTKTLKLLSKEVVFNGCSVHGIIADFQDETRIKILAFGAKSIRIYHFFPRESIRFLALTEEQQLEDWIHDVQWITHSLDRFQKDVVAVALAHNSLMLWNWRLDQAHRHFHCQEKCIVYSAKILGHSWDNLMVAVGTVFKEILLWSPVGSWDVSGRKMPLHRLCGHQGVIFSITFDYTLKLLSSTSDDRTLRLWKFIMKLPEDQNFESAIKGLPIKQWCCGEFRPVHVLYAHESRVWRSVILKSCVISVGEDSSICFWKHDGSLIKREKCHKGGSIWCLDVQKENLLAVTGGSDSGILLWNIKNILKPSNLMLTSLPASVDGNADFPRNLSVLTYKNRCLVLVMTDHGKLMVYDGKHQHWKEIFCNTSYSSYSVLSVSPTQHLILVGNICGKISLFVFKGTTHEIFHHSEWRVHDGKVNSIHWVSKDASYIVTCGLHGDMKLWQLQEKSGEFSLVMNTKLHLPQNKHHWWSSVAALVQPAKYLAVGDRVGSVFFYSLVLNHSGCDEKKTPCSTYFHIHGKNGVTDIECDGEILYTAGRDGRVLLYKISEYGVSLLHTIKAPNHMEWIGKVLLVNEDLILLGFHTTLFLGWSTKLSRTVLNIECGGGHRSWDFSMNDDFQITFAAIKKKEIITFQEELAFTLRNSSVKSGVSGREFCCIHYLFSKCTPQHGNMAFLACGGEDNTLQIIGINNAGCDSGGIIVLHNLSGHLSSIKAITSCEMRQKDSYLMVSAGGRAQLMIWKIECKSRILCKELASNILWSGEVISRKPWKDKAPKCYDPQMRYMDLAVWPSHSDTTDFEEYLIATGCSDGFLRVHKFHCEGCKLLPITTIQHGNHCIMRLSYLEMKIGSAKSLFLFAGASDGFLQMHQYEHNDSDSFRTLNCTGRREQITVKGIVVNHSVSDPLHKLRVHQSGINALDVKELQGDQWLVCSGGDDNSLAVTLLCSVSLNHGTRDEVQVLATGCVTSAHAAQITGIKILLEKFIVSVSIDQRVNIWSWTHEEDTVSLQLVRSKMTSIPDVSNMEMFWNEHSESWTVVVCGEGIEVFKLTLERTDMR